MHGKSSWFALAILALVVALTACGQPAYLPDGGRPRQVCQNNFTAIPVTVHDEMGVAVADAQVVAKNVSTGKTQIGLTDGSGRTFAFTDEIGGGQVEVTATAGSLGTKKPFVVQLTCGECDCTALPGSVTLTLSLR